LPAGLAAFLHLRIRRQDPARDFGAQTLCLVLGDHAALEVALDLAKLVSVDAQIVSGGRFAPRMAAQKRQRHKHARAKGQRPGDHPESHEPILSAPI